MKIVIAGAGAVGKHLARLLVKEQHDITIIDESQEKLESISSSLDLRQLHGNPMSIGVLKAANAQKADLFIAVTPDEAHNLTCCMLAAKMGAEKTVARVDNPEFTLEAETAFFKKMGVGSIIYPELLAGKEIVSNLKRSWIRQWTEFQNGKLVMLGIKVRANASIVTEDKPIKEICGPDAPFHIVAIKRGSETIIPHGDDFVCHDDIAFFMTTPEHTAHIRQITGKEDYPEVKTLMILGGSDTTKQTVSLLPKSISTRIFEKSQKRCEEFNRVIDTDHIMMIHGDGTDTDLLEEENIDKCDAFAALTDNSEKNILACVMAKQKGVRKTVAIVENTDYISMAENLGIGTILNKKTIAASHIYRMLLKADTTSVKSLTVANADVAEFPVMENAKVTRHPIKDLNLPASINIGGIVRNGRGILPNGNTQILPGDTVVAFCLESNIKKLEQYFK